MMNLILREKMKKSIEGRGGRVEEVINEVNWNQSN